MEKTIAIKSIFHELAELDLILELQVIDLGFNIRLKGYPAGNLLANYSGPHDRHLVRHHGVMLINRGVGKIPKFNNLFKALHLDEEGRLKLPEDIKHG